MTTYNNTDVYLKKPRSYREARKRRESRASHKTNKWYDANERKRHEMKFRNNRRYDKLYITPTLGFDETDYHLEEIFEEEDMSAASNECNIESIDHFDLLFDDIEFDRYVYKRMRDIDDEDYENRITKIMRIWINEYIY